MESGLGRSNPYTTSTTISVTRIFTLSGTVGTQRFGHNGSVPLSWFLNVATSRYPTSWTRARLVS
jgi:hypothetical protein